MSVGATIKKLRLEKGMTQAELGELLGVKKAAVQKWESGQVQNLKHSTIKSLCEVFQMNPVVFIFGTNELLNSERIKSEVGLLEEIQMTYGKDVISLMEVFLELSDRNQAKVLDYAWDMKITQDATSSVINDK